MLVCEIIDEESFNGCCELAASISSLLTLYRWLTDAFVLDFFTENHWQRLPKSWQRTFDNVKLTNIADFISLDGQKRFQCEEVWPLSLLAFRASARLLSLDREPPKDNNLIMHSAMRIPKCSLEDKLGDFTQNLSSLKDISDTNFNLGGRRLLGLDHNFRRSVKPKKQHEILRLAEIIELLIKDKTSCHIVDVGSGQGHLSRLLSLGCGYSVITIEAEESHVTGAKNLDDKVVTSFLKKDRKAFLNGNVAHSIERLTPSLQHIVLKIDNDVNAKEIETIIETTCNENTASNSNKKGEPFWLVGLHTCGSLATTMLKLLAQCPAAVGIVSVACCYMKMDLLDGTSSAFPMSKAVGNFEDLHLSYEAGEVACHAIELYQQKLKDNASSLKIHCYRATLEVLIVKYYPAMKRLGLRSVKRAETMSFSEYAKIALDKKGLTVPMEDMTSSVVQECMSQWRHVIIFYSLRLLLAPAIETLILLDRLLFLYENGINGMVIPLFDPKLSPRNHVLIAQKSPKSCESLLLASIKGTTPN